MPYAIPLRLVSQTLCTTWDGNLHIKSNPFWAWWNLRIFTSVVQLRQQWDFAGNDAVTVWEEGVGPLLEKAIRGREVMWSRGGEVEVPLARTQWCWIMVDQWLLLCSCSKCEMDEGQPYHLDAIK